MSKYLNLINQVDSTWLIKLKKSRTIGLEGLEAETLRICNAVGRWPGELVLLLVLELEMVMVLVFVVSSGIGRCSVR